MTKSQKSEIATLMSGKHNQCLIIVRVTIQRYDKHSKQMTNIEQVPTPVKRTL